MNHRIYIDTRTKVEMIELPKYGEITIMVKDGKVVRYSVQESHVFDEEMGQNVATNVEK